MNFLIPEPMSIEVIAERLIAKRRWCGEIPVTILGHSYAVARDLALRGFGPEIQLQGLLHDVTEAPLPDMPTPLKPYTFVEIDGRRVSWRAYEDMWGEAMLPPLGAAWPLNHEVKVSDVRALHFEAASFPSLDWWELPEGAVWAVGMTRVFLENVTIEDFINRYEELRE
jgi:hypothetical protein